MIIFALNDTLLNIQLIRPLPMVFRILSGRLKPGKFADLVIWSPMFFGVKPDLVLKGGSIAYAQMGDPNASIPTPQPVFGRPMFAAFGKR